jgi:hypothetical protein
VGIVVRGGQEGTELALVYISVRRRLMSLAVGSLRMAVRVEWGRVETSLLGCVTMLL